jgi:amidase
MADEIATLDASALAASIRGKELSSRELLDHYLARIDRLDGDINSVVTLDAERARGAADEADGAIARGDGVGPLHGLPITIKDAIETEGIRSTGGATELTDHVPGTDAPAVAALKQAGAIVFGKTNLPRWSGDLQAYNDIFGTTNNPWDTSRATGGSSGGAAAAVACGFTSFELGTDIGGSIRIPSHCCGVFGLKPSFGLVPQRGYLDQVGGGTTDADVNVFGPMARSARDLDLLLGVLARGEPDRAVAFRVDLPEPNLRSLADVRIGTWLDDPACPIAAEYASLLRTLADRLADAGAKVDDSHPDVDFAEQVGTFMILVGAATAVSLPPEVGRQLAGHHFDWLAVDRRRAAMRASWARWFEDHDILLCPVMLTPAIEHLHEGTIMDRTITVDGASRAYLELVSWTGLIGVVSLPSAVVPIGRTAAGLPVGVQVVAPYLHDRRAVRVAELIGEISGGYEAPAGFG